MLSLSLLSLALGTVDLSSRVDYGHAYARAVREQKDLVVYFRADARLDLVFRQPSVRRRLADFVFVQVAVEHQFEGRRLLRHPALGDMLGRPGLAVVSLHDPDLATHGEVISVHPFVGSHYGWV